MTDKNAQKSARKKIETLHQKEIKHEIKRQSGYGAAFQVKTEDWGESVGSRE